jgi:uncharacterized protein YndB with AHSA1/START domain
MGKRARAQLRIDVRRPPEDVFTYIADVRRHGEWSPKAYRVEGIDGPVQLGSTFTSYGWVPKDADHRNEVEVTAFEPPTRIQFTARERGEEYLNTYVLSAAGGGTRVDRTLDMPTPNGAGGVVFPLFLAGFIKPATQKGMRMLKANLEKGV